MEDRKKIIVICGPTASGKTNLSIQLAKQFKGEIISADSMQVYKGLDIGTAKATLEEQQAANHHLIDFLLPQEPYNVEIFTRLAKEKINEIYDRGHIPIIVGGTGLYIESLINGISFTPQPSNETVKKELSKQLEEHGAQWLYEKLVAIDPQYAANVHYNNTVRVIRALEIYETTGITMSQQIANSKPLNRPFHTLLLATGYKERAQLYANINARVDKMLEQGILQEATYVYQNKDSFVNSVAAIGYKEFFPYFDHSATLEECLDKLKQGSRNYAKRQLTWFNRMQEINWLYVDENSDYINTAINLVENFLSENEL